MGSLVRFYCLNTGWDLNNKGSSGAQALCPNSLWERRGSVITGETVGSFYSNLTLAGAG